MAARVNSPLHGRARTSTDSSGAGASPRAWTKARLAKRYIEEGIRRSRTIQGSCSATAGRVRRPGLAGGPDGWEVIRTLNLLPALARQRLFSADCVNLTSSVTGGRSRSQAISNQPRHPAEIVEWIARNDEEAEGGESHVAT